MNSDSDFDREKIKALMEKATLSLTSQAVQIYLRAPIVIGLQGQVYLEADGLKFDIKPDLALVDFYEVWLHESLHIVLGHCDNLPLREENPIILKAYQKGISIIEQTEADKEAYQNNPQEIEVRSSIISFDLIAISYAEKWFQSNDFEARIRALTRITIQKGDQNENKT